MKLIILILLFFTGNVFGQEIKESEVPASILSGFKKDHPKAEDVEWQKEETGYEVEFEDAEVEMSIGYDANGKFLESEKEINSSELPASALDYVKKNFPGKKIKETTVMTDASGTKTFEVQIEKIDYLFDDKGNFLRKVEKSKKENKD